MKVLTGSSCAGYLSHIHVQTKVSRRATEMHFFVYRNLFGYLVCYSRPLFIIYVLDFLLIQKTTIIRIYALPTVSQNVFYWRFYQSTHRKGFSTRMHRCAARCKQSSAFCGPAIFIWLYFTQMKSYTLSV